MTSSAIPFFVFQILNGEMHIVILSDGLCRLFKDSRENIKKRIENRIFSEIYPEDMSALKDVWKKFLNGSSDCDIVFKKMIDKKIRALRANGNMRVMDTGEKLYMVWFDDVTNILDDAIQNDISYDITINEEDSIKYKDSVCFIKDISLIFGGKTGINVIDIWVEVC